MEFRAEALPLCSAACKLLPAAAGSADGRGNGGTMGRLLLIILQLAVGWFAGREIVARIGLDGNLRLAVTVIVLAVIAWVLGLVAAKVLQGVREPGSPALIASLVCAAIGAALLFIPQLHPYLGGFRDFYLPLVGSVIGYHLRS